MDGENPHFSPSISLITISDFLVSCTCEKVNMVRGLYVFGRLTGYSLVLVHYIGTGKSWWIKKGLVDKAVSDYQEFIVTVCLNCYHIPSTHTEFIPLMCGQPNGNVFTYCNTCSAVICNCFCMS